MAKGTVKIYGDLVKGCIFFDGSTVEPKFLGTVFAEEKSDEAGRIIIYRTDRQDADGNNRQLFRRKKADKIQNEAGEDLVDALGYTTAQVVAYINEQANLTAAVNPVVDTSLNGVDVSFKLDATSTSIIFDNGYQYGVNTIKAVDTGDGLITIKSIEDARTLFTELDHTMVDIDGVDAAGGLNDVINVLNELFTVGAFESVVISDPYSTMIADVDGEAAGHTLVGSTSVDPAGDDIFTNSGSGNYAGLKSVSTIDQAGEYFTFDIRGEGQIGFGLIHTQDSFDDGLFSGASIYADPTTFAVSNSAHYGFQFSHWFHPTPNGSWTNYGANTSYSMRAGWSNFNGTDEQADWLAGNPIKVRCGIDTNGYISIETLRNGTDWVVHARTSYPVTQGSEFHLGIKTANSSARVFSAPKVHLLEPEAPTMYFRYIESPDGNFQYPLFATEEEANYYDEQNGGSGTSHTHVYADDPTNTTWYMPDANAVHNDTLAPLFDLSLGQSAVYTEITSLTNADQVPPAFADTSITVDELSTINYQLSPVDVGYITTVGNAYGWTVVNGTTLTGTAPEVTGDNVANPSDATTVTVYRTNSYGTSQGTLTVNITNLTAPVVTPITGVTDEGGTSLIDSDTLDNGSVVSIDNVINVGNRFTFDKEWVDNYVLPKITSGTGAKAVFIGFPKSTANWSSVGMDDFLLGYQFYSDDTSRAQNNWRLRVLVDGTIHYNVGVGGQTSGLYDYALINDGTEIKLGSLVASQGLDISSYVYNFSGVDANWKYTGGLTGISSSNKDIVIATSGTDMDLDLQYFNEYVEPTAPTSQTNWTKALDFSGGSERAQMVSTSSYYNPMMMNGSAITVASPTTSSNTSASTGSRAWSTAIVFRADGHNSNQHIWNAGEGSSGDNIYLRLSASRQLYFGWGRDGSGNNECAIGSINTNKWYGVYIGHNGTRLSGTSATASALASCFDIRITNENISWAQPTYNYSIAANWQSTGQRMDRSVLGSFTVGGRGGNRNFHGKVASMIITTLRRNVAMPNSAEIEKMIVDPMAWLNDDKVGQPFRKASSAYDSGSMFAKDANGLQGTQLWLMGDGTNDSYSNMIRNQVLPSDQNVSKLNMVSMVSNDIQTVNINGLT